MLAILQDQNLGWLEVIVETWWRYGYEVLGGLLIFGSSLVTEEMPEKWKKRAWVGFLILACIYAGVGIYLDHAAAVREDHDRKQAHADSTKLNDNMGILLITLSTGMAQLTSFHSELDDMRGKLATAKESHDPRLMANLESQLQKAQENADLLSINSLIALAPIVADQLQDTGGTWYHLADNQDLNLEEANIHNDREGIRKWTMLINETDQRYMPRLTTVLQQADYIRNGLLQRIAIDKRTKEDIEMEQAFRAAPNRKNPYGDEVAYLRKLAERVTNQKR